MGAGSQTRTWSLDPCSSGAGLQGGGAAFTPGSGPLGEAQGQSSGLSGLSRGPVGSLRLPTALRGEGWAGAGRGQSGVNGTTVHFSVRGGHTGSWCQNVSSPCPGRAVEPALRGCLGGGEAGCGGHSGC